MKKAPQKLYKYGKYRYNKLLLCDGIVSFAVSNLYQDSGLTKGQQDNEITRSYSNSTVQYTVKGRDGKDLKYYILCLSLDFKEELFEEFDADTCVEIRNPEVFFKRLEEKVRELFPDSKEGIQGCDFYARDVIYYDQSNPPPSIQQRDLVFQKSKQKYSHQNEFRVIFATDPTKDLGERLSFKIGPIAEFSKIIHKNANNAGSGITSSSASSNPTPLTLCKNRNEQSL
jgi:hypothetical protein